MAKRPGKKVVIRGVMRLAGGNGDGNGDNGDNGDENGNGDNGDNGDGNGEGPVDPGPGGSYRRLPVLKVIPLPEGAEMPTHSPTQPGKLVIARAAKRQGALAWLEKESDIPHTREEGTPPIPGHWVPVRGEDEDEHEFAFVFHVDANFGKQGATPTPQPQPAGAQRR